MLAANVSKIKKGVQYITFISDVLSENIKKKEKDLRNDLRETCFFLKTRLVAHAQLCGQISCHKCKCIQFNILT